MKLSSIVTLIVGIAILVSGVILSNIAITAATNAGHDFWEGIDTVDGNIVREYLIPAGYSDSAVAERTFARIELDVSNIDVEIVGIYDVAAESRVVLYNMTFPRTSVILTSNTVEITNSFRIDSLIDGGGQGIAFRGIHTLFSGGVFGQGGLLGPTGDQRIRIYLNNADRLLRLDLIVDNSTVSVRDIHREMDINITATGGSEVELNNISTRAALTIEAEDSTINMNAVTLSQAEMTLENSDVIFDVMGAEVLFGYYVTSDDDGRIIVNSTVTSNEYLHNHNVEGYPLIRVNQSGGSFEIRKPLVLIPPPDYVPENGAEVE
ncbi:MAG: hypothetical protein FWB93_03185 [Oscillospiraceae bacterium]|nr:hypothetical protein [Oscillospiraceae bacterium]